jgi:dihydrolipoamide dehydrogenase
VSDRDLIVIGGGEAGISAALRATQLGARVCMINREAELGGGCVRTGTLPSKILSNAAHFLENLKQGKRYGVPVVPGARADYKTILDSRHKTTMCEFGVLATLIRKNAISTMTGIASFKGARAIEVRLPDGATTVLAAPKTIIATGSRPLALPGLPFDGKVVLSADDLTAMDAVPRRLLIVGAGVIGCEMAFIFRSLGAEVVVVEKADRALLGQDHDVAALITREFKKRGIRLILKAGLARVDRDTPDGPARAAIEGGETVEADRIIIGVGRRPNTEDLGLASAGIAPGPRGELQVDDRMRTSAPGVYAAGDVLARFMLSSMAVVEARIAAENAMGLDVRMDYGCAPWGIYTDPEVGSVGASTHRLIGAHVAGQDASEIIHFAALAVKMGAGAEDLRNMVYNHPTVSEGFGKAAVDALKKLDELAKSQRTPQ